VGRAHELALLRRVVTDGPSAVVVSGPLGIGKSRLVEELGRQLRAEGAVVAVGRTWPDDSPTLRPWFEVLDAVGVDREVLAGPAADRADRFARTIDALAALDPAPTLVIDDLHTADVETLLLTRLVVRAAGGWRGAVIGTRRPGPTGSDQADALLDAIERDARLLPLGGMDVADVAEVLRRSEPEVADDVVRLVSDLTEGNPLRVRAVAAGPPDRSGRLSARVEDDVAARLAQLPLQARELVAAAAVIGGAARPSELAAACGAGPGVVAEAAGPATASGLLAPRGDGLVLAHDAIREIVLAGLGAPERGAIHGRLAQHLRGGTTDDRGRGAQHGLAAAELATGVLDDAVVAARRAAGDLSRDASLVAADGLLDRAVATTRALGHRPSADLLVERAETTLACGRLQDARRRFEEAAAEAERVDDRVSRARAALGLGGVWLGEHRETAPAERVRQLQEAAVADLPAAEGVLRARLAVRLAAEDAYRQGTTDGLAELLDSVRTTGDPSALLEALSLVHHATMHPGLERQRLALADEQLLVGTASGAELFVLVALAWRAIDLFLAGDPAAERALGELSRRADAVQCQAPIYAARLMDVMVLLRAGRIDEAEAAAATCLDLGTAVGDADALAYYGVHLFAIRTWQGRESEVLDVFEAVTRSPEHPLADRSVLAGCAVLAARAGDLDRAASILHECAADGLASIKISTTWLTCIAALAEAACALDDTDVAAQAHELLLPHADLPVMPSFAVACFGSVHRPLGTTALVLGRPDDAVAHLEAAVAACERLGNHPARLLAQSDLARALVAVGDSAAARRELRAAVGGARALGLDALAERWAAATVPALWAPGPTMARVEGGGWEVGIGDERVGLPDLVGCPYLALLLGHPGREVPALRLAMDVDLDAPGGRQDVLDGRAMVELRRRVDELRHDLDAAEAAGDALAAAARREELDAIAQHLATSLGLGGRVRSFDDLPERARTSVQKAIRRVIDRVETTDVLLADHLRRSTRTGLTCCYDPWGPTRPA